MESTSGQGRDGNATGTEQSSRTIISGESNTADGTLRAAINTGGQIGKYQIRSQLGVGGMGAVYLAFDPLIEREVAIKVLNQDVDASGSGLQRFLQEARSIGRLNHPNVVSIFDIDLWNGQYYLVMELLSGGSLAELVEQRGAIPWREACEMIAQAASGLAAAHAAGMLHRDIKPENLMRSKEGHVKVVDFGLSKLVDSTYDSKTAVTKKGQILGTPQYMSPEQFEAAEIDSRTDVYSLGASLFRLLTARFPYQDTTSIVQTMLAHLSKPAPQATTYRPDVPVECDRIIAKAMAKSPADRYQNASEMADELMDLVRSHRGSSEEATVTHDQTPMPAPTRQSTITFTRQSTRLFEKAVPLRSAVIVEPSKMLAAMFKDALGRAGAGRIQLTASKEQALQAMRSEAPDLLVTSMQLPDGVGIDLLNELGDPSTSTRTCLVIHSNDLTVNELVKAPAAASRVLAPKKVRPDDLLRVVHAVGPCSLAQGSVAIPIDPLSMRLIIMTSSGKLPKALADSIREMGLLDVNVLGQADAGSIPQDDISTVVMRLRESPTTTGDDVSYANKPEWFTESRYLMADVQFDGSQSILRSVHRLGVTATTCRALNVDTLTNLLQACRYA